MIRESEALNKISRDNRSEYPGIFERSGLHAMRRISVLWCREHPVEAAELPGWRLDRLASVLQGVT